MSLIYNTPTIIKDAIGSIVESMRESHDVTESTTTNGYTTLTVNNSLSVNDVISDELGNDFIIKSRTSSTIVVEANEWTGDKIYENKPYYLAGTWTEIVTTLMEYDKAAQVYQYMKYPLIALIFPFEEQHTPIAGHGISASLKLLFINYTNRTYKTDERYTYNFTPVLYPMFTEFMNKLQESTNIFNKRGQFTKIDHVYWGVDQIQALIGKGVLKGNDYIDAIEVKNLSLSFKNNTNC